MNCAGDVVDEILAELKKVRPALRRPIRVEYNDGTIAEAVWYWRRYPSLEVKWMREGYKDPTIFIRRYKPDDDPRSKCHGPEAFERHEIRDSPEARAKIIELLSDWTSY